MGYQMWVDPKTGIRYDEANNPKVPNPRENCFDFGCVSDFSKKGCTQQEEFVTIWLRNSPDDKKTMKLEGSDAEAARLNVGGTWDTSMPLMVAFSGPGEPCQVHYWKGKDASYY